MSTSSSSEGPEHDVPGTSDETGDGIPGLPNDETDQPTSFDPTPLHDIVDQLAAALHSYVDTSVGVRAEFDAATADDDPRVEAAEARIEQLNTALEDAFEARLGMTSAHTWTAGEDADDAIDGDKSETEEALHLEIVIDTETVRSDVLDSALHRAMEHLDTAANEVVDQLQAAGATVNGWSCVHEFYMRAEDEDDD